jgi:hypothetical protein
MYECHLGTAAGGAVCATCRVLGTDPPIHRAYVMVRQWGLQECVRTILSWLIQAVATDPRTGLHPRKSAMSTGPWSDGPWSGSDSRPRWAGPDRRGPRQRRYFLAVRRTRASLACLSRRPGRGPTQCRCLRPRPRRTPFVLAMLWRSSRSCRSSFGATR